MTPPDGKEAVATDYSIFGRLRLFKGLDLKQAFFGHASLALADQAMVSGVNFLVGILLARLLGVAGYGRFVLAFSAVHFFEQHSDGINPRPNNGFGGKEKSG